jgi:hypothetical protein
MTTPTPGAWKQCAAVNTAVAEITVPVQDPTKLPPLKINNLTTEEVSLLLSTWHCSPAATFSDLLYPIELQAAPLSPEDPSLPPPHPIAAAKNALNINFVGVHFVIFYPSQ